MSRASQHTYTQRRRRYFVDPEVQGALLRHAILHWLWTSTTFALIVLVFRVAPAWLSGTDREAGRIWYHMAPYVVASIVLLPIVVFSAIRFSNRFTGPMVRVRRCLKQLAHGETPPRLVLRDHDFWSDIAEDVNAISSRLGQPNPATPADPDPDSIPVSAAYTEA